MCYFVYFRSSTERVTINVTDVNIHEPKFEIYDRSLSILESTEIGTILVILKVIILVDVKQL
jgi:hypothetical protein